MYNKKKKHFGTSQKPHYTRQELGPDGQPLPQTEQTTAPAAPVSVEQNHQETAPASIDLNGNTAPVPADQTVAAGPEMPNDASVQQTEAPKTVPANPANPNDVVIYPFKSKNNPNPVGLPVDPNAPPVPNCQICNMPVRSVNTAVHHKESNELVHFDCALRELSKEFTPKLGRGRKIYYVGAGNFALVKEIYDRRGHLKSYEVVERIPYEPEEK